MNLPNKLTLTRVALIPLMVLLMCFDNTVCHVLAALVFAGAAVTDFLDGNIARKRNMVTDFGKFLDPVADKLLVLSALIMLCSQGMMFHWALVVILARELSVDGLRMIAVGRGQVIAAGPLGKVKTVSQIIFILWLMVTRLGVADSVISILLMFWVMLITIWSGVDYFVHNGAFLLKDMGKRY